MGEARGGPRMQDMLVPGEPGRSVRGVVSQGRDTPCWVVVREDGGDVQLEERAREGSACRASWRPGQLPVLWFVSK